MFSLNKENSEFKTIVFDVIRIFIGEYKWEDLDRSDYPEIKVLHQNNTIEIVLENYKNEEVLEDSSDNNIKRVIKKLLYKLLEEHYFKISDSWGILTGIRPTKIVHRMIDQGYKDEDIFKHLTEEYLLKENKAKLLLEITNKQREYFLTKEESFKKIAIYISIPFCPSICSYCTFGSYLLSKYSKLLETYLDNLNHELETVLKYFSEKGFITDKIYFGGGTPSILSVPQLERIFSTIKTYISLENIVEFSFEAGRPDTIDLEKLQFLKTNGVTRISINPQIMNDSILKKLGRKHLTQDILSSYAEGKEIGFNVINMDLIMGVEDSYQEFTDSLEEVIKLSPENITIHSLAFKRKSAMEIDEKKLHAPNQSEHFDQSILKLRDAGYEPYYLYKQKLTVGGQENIGFAKDGKYSPYNIQMIEERQVILGFGVGASSKLINQHDLTLENVFNPKDLYYYNDKIEEVIKKKIDYLDKISKEYEYGNQKA
ncbi:MAG: coproporphyrinogen dehydrogenase HemZ [Clostridia bacterium]|nr:coproporphyrinogen dehydrogenase HemZ [Clostridia bacterium]